ncbi:acyl[acyl-carrier-protein]-UDP-N-acetylglucosamine O-acyltransferase [Candidatus Photodesmus blepharus]|uniref:Acyl-[acyl-carrier-protein]--UDP-N-acetylglucosamine O-acyltransferase n=1 Tax=Candidatus Photodesmus blepharonis TaxID=1179155 RepID=A0A084CNY6_9GAMM|nr:acyl-ACP--UDP-N-acetylglucosamine O-acyltransferase [Candidatus Photodesmus blepharus]KEY91515.1 acyl[acyl-carrier-protein]-UDP-N-acetylglucosamine O-acyltransferase [Candidatus Photodesmus blepharus]
MIHKTAKIHPNAVVEEGAVIGANVLVGPFSYITFNAEIGSGTEVMSHVVIKGPTVIGKNNRIFPFAVIGEVCQDKKYQGEDTLLLIGNRNIIRESVQMHRGTVQGHGVTTIGNDNLFCVNVHIAHDCIIGNNIIMGNNATLAGHVTIEDYAILSALSPVHQFCTIGAHSFIGGASVVVQDVPPYIMAQGNHCKPFGINIEGLKRRGFKKEEIYAIRKAYKEIYRSGKRIAEVKPILEEMAKEYPSIALFTQLIENSTRGIIR